MLKICVNTRRCYDRETKEALDFNTLIIQPSLLFSPNPPTLISRYFPFFKEGWRVSQNSYFRSKYELKRAKWKT